MELLTSVSVPASLPRAKSTRLRLVSREAQPLAAAQTEAAPVATVVRLHITSLIVFSPLIFFPEFAGGKVDPKEAGAKGGKSS